MAITVLKVIRVILLCLSCYGYLYLIVDKGKIKVEFSPAILFSAIGSAMFFAGILNILKETCVAILVAGIIFAIYSFVKKYNPLRFICPGTIFFLICLVYFCYFYYGRKLQSYDDFSHWGTVARLMLESNRLPNFQDNIIMFQSYPTGSAGFIYFIGKATGIRSEWIMPFSQTMLTMSCFVCLFAFVKHKITGYIGIVCFCITVICSQAFVLSGLLVDVLLPMIALSGMLIGIYYTKEINRVLWAVMPSVVFLIAIKNSGLFFSVVIIVYVLLCVQWKTVKKGSLTALVLSPFISLVLWQKHVKLVFSDGLSSKHTMAVDSLKESFLEKDPKIIAEIKEKFFSAVFSLQNIFLLFLLLAGVTLLLIFIFQKQQFGFSLRLIILSSVSYLVYQGSMLVMYLTSMPADEALMLASYNRYHWTVMIFMMGILLAVILQTEFRNRAVSALITIFAIAVNFFVFPPQLSQLQKKQLSTPARETLETLIKDYRIPYGSSCILFSHDDAGYDYFLCRYLLRTTSIDLYMGDPTGKTPKDIYSYDYIIIADPTEETRAYVKDVLKIDDTRQVIRLKK